MNLFESFKSKLNESCGKKELNEMGNFAGRMDTLRAAGDRANAYKQDVANQKNKKVRELFNGLKEIQDDVAELKEIGKHVNLYKLKDRYNMSLDASNRGLYYQDPNNYRNTLFVDTDKIQMSESGLETSEVTVEELTEPNPWNHKEVFIRLATEMLDSYPGYIKAVNEMIDEYDLKYPIKSQEGVNESCDKKDLKEDEYADDDGIYEECYAPAQDITFIMKWSREGEKGTKGEVTGFYHGEPDESATKQFRNKPDANYDMPMAPVYSDEEIEDYLNEGCSKDKELDEAPNPENAEINAKIAQALEGKREYNKVKKDLDALGFEAYSNKGSGKHIAIENPKTGKTVSSEDTGWNGRNITLRNYRTGESRRFSGSGNRKAQMDDKIDYVNFLNKSNDYQNEVTNAQGSYRRENTDIHDKDQWGYNRWDEFKDQDPKDPDAAVNNVTGGYNSNEPALLPEEKSLNKTTRKYIGAKDAYNQAKSDIKYHKNSIKSAKDKYNAAIAKANDDLNWDTEYHTEQADEARKEARNAKAKMNSIIKKNKNK